MTSTKVSTTTPTTSTTTTTTDNATSVITTTTDTTSVTTTSTVTTTTTILTSTTTTTTTTTISTTNTTVTTTTTLITTAYTTTTTLPTCLGNWRYYSIKKAYFKSVLFEVTGGFQSLSAGQISEKCGCPGSTLVLRSEFDHTDFTWLNNNMCYAKSDAHNYFGPPAANGNNCPIFKCSNSFTTHDCSHGTEALSGTHHALFCKYIP
jgi:hypothetical protein